MCYYLSFLAVVSLLTQLPDQVVMRHAEVLQHPPYGPVDGNIYVGVILGEE